MEAKGTALESMVSKHADNGEAAQSHVISPGSPHGLQNGSKRQNRKQTTPKIEKSIVANKVEEQCSESPTNTHHFDMEYPQKSPQSGVFEGHRGVVRSRKYLKGIGSSGRTRTYNPSVNSRMLCH